MEKERLTIAYKTAQYLVDSIREAHAKTISIPTEIILFDMLEQAELMSQRLKRLADADPVRLSLSLNELMS